MTVEVILNHRDESGIYEDVIDAIITSEGEEDEDCNQYALSYFEERLYSEGEEYQIIFEENGFEVARSGYISELYPSNNKWN